ncbi:MAG TPA: response regulator [Methylotenera sp.]|nr:response regulator [Methylotenera sp.]
MHTVLIVDDQADIRRMMNFTLRDEFSLLEAADGVAALALIRQHKPDVVLLDIMMPGGMDGLQVLETIRSDPALQNIRVIMIFARGQVEECEFGIKRGSNAYFVKPFSPAQLLAAIHEQIAVLKKP